MAQKKPKHKRNCKKHISHPNSSLIFKCNDEIRNHKADSNTFFNLAKELIQCGDIKGALKNYRKGLKKSPFDNSALIPVSVILISLSNFVQAIIYLTNAIVHTPQLAIAYVYRSVAYLGAGKKFEAYLDFKFIYEKYPEFIHHFTNLDISIFPQIDFDEALEFCLNPKASEKPWPWPEVYFPTEDCPVDEICLHKELCLQSDVCPQNDMTLFKTLITQPKLCLPGKHEAETILIDIDALMAGREPSQPAIFSDLPVKIHSSFRLHWKRSIHKLMRFYINAKLILNSIFYSLFFFLFLPLNEILAENDAIFEF